MQMAEALQKLSSVLEETTQQVAAIQEILKDSVPNSATEALKPATNPEAFSQLGNQIDEFITSNRDATKRLDSLQNRLEGLIVKPVYRLQEGQ